MDHLKFNRMALTIISVLAIGLIFRLIEAATISGNWRGFFYTALHISIVAIGSYLAIRKKPSIETD